MKFTGVHIFKDFRSRHVNQTPLKRLAKRHHLGSCEKISKKRHSQVTVEAKMFYFISK